MNLLVLDKRFAAVGAINDYVSLLWNRKYYEPGNFELHTISQYWGLINSGIYLWKSDAAELGVIEEVTYQKNDSGSITVTCKGHFAEVLLNKDFCSFSHETIDPITYAYDMVSFWVRNKNNSADDGDPVWALGAGKIKNRSPVRLDFTAASKGLGEKMYELEKYCEATHTISYDYEHNWVSLYLWQGKDRTTGQTENSWALFSDAFCNVKSCQYHRSLSGFMDTAMVFGEGEGDDRIWKKVQVDGAKYSGYCLVVDARDLQKTYKDGSSVEHTYSDAEYEKVLEQRGRDKLAKHPVVETVSCEVDYTANLVYKKDYDLGDICTVQLTEIGVEANMRLTEIAETYENGRLKLSVEFGEGVTTNLREIIRREL